MTRPQPIFTHLTAPLPPEGPGAAAPSALVPAAQAGEVKPLFRPTRLLRRDVEEVERTTAEAQARLRAARQRAAKRLRRRRAAIKSRLAAATLAVERSTSDQLAASVAQLAESYRALQQDDAARAAELALRVAEQILRQQLTADPTALFGLIATALEDVRFARSLVIGLHPLDLANVGDALRQLPSVRGAHEQVELRADASLPRWHVRIETSTMGSVEAGLGVALGRVRRALGLPAIETGSAAT